MDYLELNVPVTDTMQSEILIAELAVFPFESFVEEEGMLKAYIPGEKLAGCKDAVDAMLAGAEVAGARYIAIETVNWNAVWESNFEPVDVDGQCVIRAPFHPRRDDVRLEVVIMPKMSFGTGHHATTHLVTAEIMKRDFSGLYGLDMGSGTGVLAIVAAKLGASRVDAVDIDQWAYENSAENIAANAVEGVVVPILGDVSAVKGRVYDFIFANINRNILLSDMPSYAAMLKTGGEIILCGIFYPDVEAISRRASECGMETTATSLRDGWAAVTVVKK